MDISITISKKELQDRLIKALKPGNEHLAEVITQLLDDDRDRQEIFLKALLGIPQKLSYKVSTRVAVPVYKLADWSFDKPAMEAANMIRKIGTEMQIEVLIISVSQYKPDPYEIIYKYLDSAGVIRTGTTFINESSIRPAFEKLIGD